MPYMVTQWTSGVQVESFQSFFEMVAKPPGLDSSLWGQDLCSGLTVLVFHRGLTASLLQGAGLPLWYH